MRNSDPWSVDRLAAGQLLSELGLESTDDLLDRAARHFSEHRKSLIKWAAEQAHARIVQKLESLPRDDLAQHGDDWSRGFSFAEERVMTMRSDELLDLAPERARSRGQILRTLVRQARER